MSPFRVPNLVSWETVPRSDLLASSVPFLCVRALLLNGLMVL